MYDSDTGARAPYYPGRRISVSQCLAALPHLAQEDMPLHPAMHVGSCGMTSVSCHLQHQTPLNITGYAESHETGQLWCV